jgi:hypothetical protein
MISRREVVTAGVLGTLATSTAAEAAAQGSDAATVREGLNKIVDSLDDIKTSLDALHTNSMNQGALGQIKIKLEIWVKATGKFPDYWDVGIGVFLEIYDWHVRQQQPIQISRIAEQRMAIQWIFTQYVLRWENDPTYIGPQPYDR